MKGLLDGNVLALVEPLVHVKKQHRLYFISSDIFHCVFEIVGKKMFTYITQNKKIN